MGRKRRSRHSPKFANRMKFAALKKSPTQEIEDSVHIEPQQEVVVQSAPEPEIETVAPEILLFNEPEPVIVDKKEKPKRKPRKTTTKKRTTRRKTTKKEAV